MLQRDLNPLDGRNSFSRRSSVSQVSTESDDSFIKVPMIQQAYSLCKAKPRVFKELGTSRINLSVASKTAILQSDKIARIKCSLEWLQKALNDQSDDEDFIYTILIAYLDISRECLNLFPPVEVVEFGQKLLGRFNNDTKESYVEWEVFFRMIMAYFFVSVQENGTMAVEDAEISAQILKASNLAINYPRTRSVYMKMLVAISLNITKPEKIFGESKLKSNSLHLIFTRSVTNYKGILQTIRQLLARQKLNSQSEDDIFVDPVFMLLELTRQTLHANLLEDARAFLHLIEIALDSTLSLDMDLSIKFCREEYYCRSTPQSDKIKSFERLSKLIYQAANANCHEVVVEASSSYWNLIYPSLKEEQEPSLVRTFEIVFQSLDNVSRHFEFEVPTELKDRFEREIARFYNYNHYFIKSSNETTIVLDDAAMEKVKNLVDIGSKLVPDQSYAYFKNALILIIEGYEYKTFENRIQSLTTEYLDSLTFNDLKLAMLIELIQKARQSLKLVDQKVKSDNEHVLQLWDITYVATVVALHCNGHTNQCSKIEYIHLFGIKDIQIQCFLDGFFTSVTPESTKPFLQAVIGCISRELTVAKSIGKSWMIHNSVSHYWRLNCLFEGKILWEGWNTAITQAYEILNEFSAKNGTMIVLISLIHANLIIDQFHALSSKAPAKGNAREANLQLLKTAEDVLKAATTVKDADIVTMMLLLPAWNRLQQSKPTTGNAATPPSVLEFEDPILKQAAIFESASVKNETTKAIWTFETIESNFNSIATMEKIPVIFRIRLYHKLAKIAADVDCATLSIGIFCHAIVLIDAFLLNDGISDDFLEWCTLVKLDCFGCYLALLKTQTNLFDNDAVEFFLRFYETVGRSKTLTNSILTILADYFWDYISFFTNECNAEVIIVAVARFLAICKSLFESCSRYKNLFLKNIAESGAETLNKIFALGISISKQVNEPEHTTRMIQKIYQLIPHESRIHIYIQHPELWELQEKSFHSKSTISTQGKTKIAFALVEKLGHMQLLVDCRNALELDEKVTNETIVEFYLECYLRGVFIEITEKTQLLLPSKTLEQYTLDPPKTLILGFIHDIQTLKSAGNAIQDEKIFELLQACKSRILGLVNQLIALAKSKAVQTTEDVKQPKKGAKPEKGAKKDKGENEQQDGNEITLPMNWENYQWPTILVSTFADATTNALNSKTLSKPFIFIARMIDLVKIYIEKKDYASAFSILHFLELNTEKCISTGPLIHIFVVLLHAFVQHKSSSQKSKIKEYLEKMTSISSSDYLKFLELQKSYNSQSLTIVMVDLLIYFDEFEKAQILTHHLAKFSTGIDDATLKVAISRMVYLANIGKDHRKCLSFVKLIIKNAPKLTRQSLQGILSWTICGIESNENSDATYDHLLEIYHSLQNLDHRRISDQFLLEEYEKLKFNILSVLNSVRGFQYHDQVEEFYDELIAKSPLLDNLQGKSLEKYISNIINGPMALPKTVRSRMKRFLAKIAHYGYPNALTPKLIILKCMLVIDNEFLEKEKEILVRMDPVTAYLLETDPKKNKGDVEVKESEYEIGNLLSELQDDTVFNEQSMERKLCIALLTYCQTRKTDEAMNPDLTKILSDYLFEFAGKSQSRLLRIASNLLAANETIPDRFKYLTYCGSCDAFENVQSIFAKYSKLKSIYRTLELKMAFIDTQDCFLRDGKELSSTLSTEIPLPTLKTTLELEKRTMYIQFVVSNDRKSLYCGVAFKKLDAPNAKPSDKKKGIEEKYEEEVVFMAFDGKTDLEHIVDDCLGSITITNQIPLPKTPDAAGATTPGKESNTKTEIKGDSKAEPPVKQDSTFHAIVFVPPTLDSLDLEFQIKRNFPFITTVSREFCTIRLMVDFELLEKRPRFDADQNTEDPLQKKKETKKTPDKKKDEEEPVKKRPDELSILISSLNESYSKDYSEATANLALNMNLSKQFRIVSSEFRPEEKQDMLTKGIFLGIGCPKTVFNLQNPYSITTNNAGMCNLCIHIHTKTNNCEPPVSSSYETAALLSVLGVSCVITSHEPIGIPKSIELVRKLNGCNLKEGSFKIQELLNLKVYGNNVFCGH